MKNLVLATLFILSAQIQAACTDVAGICVNVRNWSDKTSEFLTVEAKLGQNIYDLNHVNFFQAYSAKNAANFAAKDVPAATLDALNKWATKTIGNYEETEYTATEMKTNAKKMDYNEFQDFLDDAFLDAG